MFLSSTSLTVIISLSILNFLSLNAISADADIPLVMVHGLGHDYTEFIPLQQHIAQDFPNMKTFALDACNNFSSRGSLWGQIPIFNDLLKNITDQYGEVNLLGYSQGGQIARAMVETSGNHNIKTFISLSAPAVGEYGVFYVEQLGELVMNLTAREVYHICYTTAGQNISVCNYWNDPNQQSLYLEKNIYLPYINNELNHSLSEHYKNNFMNLQKLVLIGGPDDGVIIPWQTAQYGYYDSNFDIVPYNEQEFYKGDWFGLKTLDEQNKVEFCTMALVPHHAWPRNEIVYEKCIKPHLS